MGVSQEVRKFEGDYFIILFPTLFILFHSLAGGFIFICNELIHYFFTFQDAYGESLLDIF